MALISLWKKLNSSIHIRMISLTCGLIVGVVVVLSLVIATTAVNLLREESQLNTLQIARQGASDLQRFLTAREANLDLWTSSPVVFGVMNNASLEEIYKPVLNSNFIKIQEKSPWLTGLILMRDGRAVYEFGDVGISRNLTKVGSTESTYFNELSDTGFHFAEFPSETPGASKNFAIVMKRPLIRNEVELPGKYIIAFFDISKIRQELFSNMRVGSKGFLTIFGKTQNSGMFISAHRETESTPSEMERALEDALNGLSDFETIPSEGRKIILAHSMVSGLPISVIGIASTEDIFQPVQNIILKVSLVGFIAAIIGVAASICVTRKVTFPIVSLSKSVKSFTLGSHNIRAVVTTEDEVGVLASNFNEMLEELDKAYLKLESYSRELEGKNTDLAHFSTILSKLLKGSREIAQSRDRTYAVAKTAALIIDHLGVQSETKVLYGYFSRTSDHLVMAEEFVVSRVPDGQNAHSHKHILIDEIYGIFDKNCLDPAGFSKNFPEQAVTFLENSSIYLLLKQKDRAIGFAQIFLGEFTSKSQNEQNFIESLSQSLSMVFENFSHFEDRMAAEQKASNARLEELGNIAVKLGDRLNTPLNIISLCTEEIGDLKAGSKDTPYLLQKLHRSVSIIKTEVASLNRFRSYAKKDAVHEDYEGCGNIMLGTSDETSDTDD